MCTISDNIEKLSNISLENAIQAKSANSIVNTKLIKLVQDINDYKQYVKTMFELMLKHYVVFNVFDCDYAEETYYDLLQNFKLNRDLFAFNRDEQYTILKYVIKTDYTNDEFIMLIVNYINRHIEIYGKNGVRFDVITEMTNNVDNFIERFIKNMF